ncbi:sensor histidine kinase [Flammeovirga sp. EKP202]|uniref:sensor histidine kinase n=1 Tax=Flammeovirga sp. EKP202 TaxID=2770592 RepID=UPI00165F3AA7|nr:histidine kinase [Flammeovirga sp. EKP202]MBD0404459.1 histidine kinase [Flammeovirga sp. EKP202]
MKERFNLSIPSKAVLPLITIALFIFLLSTDFWLGAKFALIRASITTGIFLFVVITNIELLVPQLLIKRNRNLFYVIAAIVLYIVAIKILLFLSRETFHLLDPELFFAEHIELREKLNGQLTFEWIWPFGFGSVFILISILVSTVLKLSSHDEKEQLKKKELVQGKIEAELKFLRSQINPHFLFNALNNIYSMSYMQMPQATDNIAKLSEMLRYLLYDCNEEIVALEKDITYLHNYIDFQQLKTESPQNISFLIDIQNPQFKIAPMLLEPFIENAFKYSRLEENPEGFVKIELKQQEEQLTLKVSNSVTDKVSRIAVGGIGLKNVQKRLDLIYPKKHQLDINEGVQEFEIKLEIKNS